MQDEITCSIQDADCEELFWVNFIPCIGHEFYYWFDENMLTKGKWTDEAIESWRKPNAKHFRVESTHTEVRNYDGKMKQTHSAIVREFEP